MPYDYIKSFPIFNNECLPWIETFYDSVEENDPFCDRTDIMTGTVELQGYWYHTEITLVLGNISL